MFKPHGTLDSLNQLSNNTISGLIGIEFLELGSDFLVARMPVDQRTHQPFGLLHGGASVVLAETMGSIASFLTLEDPTRQQAVGLEINANHLKGVSSGWVYGRCSPVHVGRRTQVWEIRITSEAGDLVCISRITVMVIEKK
ncbi:MAG: hotdog fold thioesterase [Spirosomataceae bacterium]